MSNENQDVVLVQLRPRKIVREQSVPKRKKISKIKEIVKQRIHILSWITSYNRNILISDFIAGVTLGLTIIPQSIAYAALAGLPSQYGLYSAFIGSIIYVFFGSVKEVSIGPTALQSLLAVQYTHDKPIGYTIVLTFLAGCVEFLMGALRLGFIVDFISTPVTSAFTSATSIIIIVSQLKGIAGINYASKEFIDTIWLLIQKFDEFDWKDFSIGFGTCLFLLALRQLKDYPFKKDRKQLKKIIWYLSISRNALAILIGSSIAFFIIQFSGDENYKPFALSGKVAKGMPHFEIPNFTLTQGNQTFTFMQICSDLSTGILVVPLVAVLANVAIAKSFSSGKVVDATQEMLTLGICNIVGSCFQSMPTCGAFTRSAVSHASGVKTPLSGFYTGVMTILALSLLTPYFYFIPKSTLSAVLICAVLFMIDLGLAKKLWIQSRRDFYAWLVCFVVCILMGVEIGLLCGVIVNIIYLLHMWARPEIKIKINDIDNIQYIRAFPSVGMFYPGVDYLREKIYVAAAASEYRVPVVIDCSKVTGLDYTSAKGLGILANDLKKHNQILIIKNMELTLQKSIDISHDVLFCNKERTLKEFLIQENLKNGTIPLMQHIRDSIELGYKVDPIVLIEDS